jgi:murein DD-endopeptidase MepM/ murein hydrolase activator NlpD
MLPQEGEAMYAIEDGIIAGFEGSMKHDPNGNANAVIIQGSDGFLTVYAHVSPYPLYKVGDPVKQGDFIGNIDL